MLRHVKNSVLPHRGNQYRPHAIRHYGLAVALAVLLGVNAWQNFALTGQIKVLGAATDVSVIDLLSLTNQERRLSGSGDVRLNEELSRAAQAKADHMMTNNYWSHDAPDGTTPWVFVNKAGYDYDKAGENLAYGFATSQGAVTGWMNSPGHKANLLDEAFVDVGFGTATGEFQGNENTVIVALYGRPKGSAPFASRSNPSSDLAVRGSNQLSASGAKSTNFGAVLSGNASPITVATVMTTLLIAAVYAMRHAVAIKQIVASGQHYVVGHPLLEASLVYGVIWLVLFGTYGALL